MRFIFFAGDFWHDHPRLRKQIASLLIDHGHQVLYFQKTSLSAKSKVDKVNENLTLYTMPHLFHRQLKLFTAMGTLDSTLLRKNIKKLIDFKDTDIVVNFLYDYYFLRSIFKNNKIITIINDDYIGGANLLHRRLARELLSQTARMSDQVLVVSYFLFDQLRQFTPKVATFFPWARTRYRKPPMKGPRDEMIYWGFINSRIDFEIMQQVMDSGVTIHYVGHISKDRRVKEMLAHHRAQYYEPGPLKDIGDILDRCCCSILPYDPRHGMVLAITINNRAFEILSFGLPLLYRNLPGVLKAPKGVIYYCDTAWDFCHAFEQSKTAFANTQSTIEQFLREHYPENRYHQFMQYVEKTLNGE